MCYAQKKKRLYRMRQMGSEKMEMSMSCLQVGQQGKITRLAACDELSCRLLDFGMTPGTAVLCLKKSPAGDPSLYRIRGTMLALRRKDSRDVFVEVAS